MLRAKNGVKAMGQGSRRMGKWQSSQGKIKCRIGAKAIAEAGGMPRIAGGFVYMSLEERGVKLKVGDAFYQDASVLIIYTFFPSGLCFFGSQTTVSSFPETSFGGTDTEVTSRLRPSRFMISWHTR